jgi:hypothetical protein
MKKLGGWAIGIGVIVAIKAGLSGTSNTPTSYTPAADTTTPAVSGACVRRCIDGYAFH